MPLLFLDPPPRRPVPTGPCRHAWAPKARLIHAAGRDGDPGRVLVTRLPKRGPLITPLISLLVRSTAARERVSEGGSLQEDADKAARPRNENP